jgi:hypothetical protein
MRQQDQAMSKLKRIGRKKRRLDKGIDKMRPGKMYAITSGGKTVVLKGKDWKAIKQEANEQGGSDN